jgi:ketosteroid isomerase-like protein
MLRRTLVVVLAAAATLAAQGASAPAEVKKAELNWAAAVQKNDIKTLEKIMAPDMVYTHSTALVENREQYLAKLKSGDQKYASIEHINPRFQAWGTTGVVTTKVRMTGATKGVPFDNQLMMIHVWIRQGNNWLLVAHQTTKVP